MRRRRRVLRRLVPARLIRDYVKRLFSIPARKAVVGTVSILVGASAGYAYYHYVGCVSGTCPITGNPWMSTGYGALIGWLAASGMRRRSAGRMPEDRS